METEVNEIADRIYRLSTFVADAGGPGGFTFNQFLIEADEPLLFHCGPRRMFPLVSEALARVMPVERLRWITFGHVEADECGSMNDWLAAAPRAEVAHGAVACMVQLNDLADRPPRILADGQVLDLGGKRVRYFDTPHVPHGWEACSILEETSATLFCGDLFAHSGHAAPVVESDIVAPAIAAEERFHAMCLGPNTGSTIRRLADTEPKLLALMHGPAFRGDGAAALRALADHYGGRAGHA